MNFLELKKSSFLKSHCILYLWLIFLQLEEFRKVSHIVSGTPTADDMITENYRPVQQLGGRKVYASYSYQTQGSSSTYPSLLAVVILSFMALFHINQWSFWR